MFLTLTTTHRPATDLGFLLHKHPDRVQQFAQSTGTATVFYPEASEERCTAALLLEIDAVRLARSAGRGVPDFSLAQYVNDRSYAASSLLGVALADVFSTARSGRCRSRQELADSAIPLQLELPVLPCRGGPGVAHRIFEPLGWQVEATSIPLDRRFDGWGESRYVRLSLSGTLRLADALNQLYVLLPVLDEAKHYWQGPDEVEKLLRSGAGWLAGHPERAMITRRYLGRHDALTRVALSRLAELDGDHEESVDPVGEEEVAQPAERRQPLNEQRHDALLAALRRIGPDSVIDLGCGSGQFLARLIKEPGLTKITGMDVSIRSLQAAARRLRLDPLNERQAARIDLFQGSLTYEDARLSGYSAAVLMEVIEHLDPSRLGALERVVFAAARPAAVLVSTPNAEYNANYEGLSGMRHPDHRFEWSRADLAAWAQRVAGEHGYSVELTGIGEEDPEHGTPTQLAVFHRG
ncbi:3' terminal RNA ribose 2'-O-methyltransferase Hen1 [Microlunatus speluncae]|uniref:3' terminal RNA ribose 2'-O-methyltransferase Hen1 n=1 Tax=Microlunatus speluncae TaxID=2594267 RepID=UPI0012663BDE|nr:3' terminal RNA ribose 2'-O-methyltransferase Hen1 [Microlunatus speluncae]